MALLVHQQFAVNAFVALSSQTPDTVCTDGTVGSLLRRADQEKSTSKTSTDYIPGDNTEALMASESRRPAGPPLTPSINTKTNYLKAVDVSFAFKHTDSN